MDIEQQYTQATLDHYKDCAERFWAGTKDHDVSQNRDALLKSIDTKAPYKILDLGCGPGRDLKAFKDMGHEPVGIDGCEEFCQMARAYSGVDVLHQRFLALDLPKNMFDGVFANASLFHVPTTYLSNVLACLHKTLKPEGILLASNPRGENEEVFHEGRYGAYYNLQTWVGHVESVGFELLEHYYRPADVPPEEQKWLVTVFKVT